MWKIMPRTMALCDYHVYSPYIQQWRRVIFEKPDRIYWCFLCILKHQPVSSPICNVNVVQYTSTYVTVCSACRQLLVSCVTLALMSSLHTTTTITSLKTCTPSSQQWPLLELELCFSLSVSLDAVLQSEKAAVDWQRSVKPFTAGEFGWIPFCSCEKETLCFIFKKNDAQSSLLTLMHVAVLKPYGSFSWSCHASM